MPRSTPTILRFLDTDVGREFVCRLWRASHCGSCLTNQLQCQTMEEILLSSSFQSFLAEICELWSVDSLVGSLDTYSRDLESPHFVSSLDSTMALERTSRQFKIAER